MSDGLIIFARRLLPQRLPSSRVQPADAPSQTAEPVERSDVDAENLLTDVPEQLSGAISEEVIQAAIVSVETAEENPGAEDALCVGRVLAGDTNAFAQLVEKYQRQAVVVSYRLLGNHDDARDVVQDAMVKAFRSLETLERPAAFGGWLMRIVTNVSLNFRRGRRLRIAQPLDGAVADHLGNPTASDRPMRGHGSDSLAKSGDPRRAAEGRELGDALREALKQLPEKQRNALILFTIEELPQKDVAERLECSVEAVKWHVFQARKKLKELLKDAM